VKLLIGNNAVYKLRLLERNLTAKGFRHLLGVTEGGQRKNTVKGNKKCWVESQGGNQRNRVH